MSAVLKPVETAVALVAGVMLPVVADRVVDSRSALMPDVAVLGGVCGWDGSIGLDGGGSFFVIKKFVVGNDDPVGTISVVVGMGLEVTRVNGSVIYRRP